MWWAHTMIDSAAMATNPAMATLYPNTGLRAKVLAISSTAATGGRRIT